MLTPLTYEQYGRMSDQDIGAWDAGMDEEAMDFVDHVLHGIGLWC